MPKRPTPLVVSERQQRTLEGLMRRNSSPQWVVQRSRLIMAISVGICNAQVAREQGVTVDTVRLWRARWVAGAERLAALEEEGCPDKALSEQITALLADAPCSGAPPLFSATQVVQILQLACTPPPEVGCPCAQWSERELALAAVRQGLVAQISPRTVGRFLKDGGRAAAPHALLAHAASG